MKWYHYCSVQRIFLGLPDIQLLQMQIVCCIVSASNILHMCRSNSEYIHMDESVNLLEPAHHSGLLCKTCPYTIESSQSLVPKVHCPDTQSADLHSCSGIFQMKYGSICFACVLVQCDTHLIPLASVLGTPSKNHSGTAEMLSLEIIIISWLCFRQHYHYRGMKWY